jgi:uncharacterized membrane protein
MRVRGHKEVRRGRQGTRFAQEMGPFLHFFVKSAAENDIIGKYPDFKGMFGRRKMKRKITKPQLEFLQRELEHFAGIGMLSMEQSQAMLASYEVREKFSFVRILLVIGALLVGAGVLSFIAGNWSVIPKTAKMMIILLGLCLFYLAGWKTENAYPKTSKSLYYAGMFIYGAGIFLVGQMFHLNGDLQGAFLLWALGVTPLAIYLKDRWAAAFTVLLLAVYGFALDRHDPYPWALLFYIPLLYWLNETRFKKSKVLLFFVNALAVLFVISSLRNIGIEFAWIAPLVFIGGLLMIFVPPVTYKSIFSWQGSLLIGFTGIIMTLAEYWEELGVARPEIYSLGFSLLYFGLILFLLKMGLLPAVLLACLFIFRYYVDLSFDFLPKSLFFVLGGLILIAFGFWFEKKRRGGHEQ